MTDEIPSNSHSSKPFKNLQLPFNGVKSLWLIELSKSILESCWVMATMLISSENSDENIDTLTVQFKDIDGSRYCCEIYDNKTVDVYAEFDQPDDGGVDSEFLKNVTFDDFKKYLDSLPITAAKYFG